MSMKAKSAKRKTVKVVRRPSPVKRAADPSTEIRLSILDVSLPGALDHPKFVIRIGAREVGCVDRPPTQNIRVFPWYGTAYSDSAARKSVGSFARADVAVLAVLLMDAGIDPLILNVH